MEYKTNIFSQINNIEEFFITKKDFNSDYIVNKLLSADKQNKLNEKYKNTAYIYIKNIIKQI